MGFFVKREDNTIDMSDVLYSSSINLLVRYCNLPDSIEWSRLYGSIGEYNGDKLGIVNGTFYDTLSEKYFSDSEFVYGDNVFDLIKKLLLCHKLIL